MKIEIKHRWSGSILFAVETSSWRLAVEAAVKSRADLTGADLTGADLTGADLTGANLTRADLTRAVNMRLPTGELFTEYVAEVVPALLTAGGKSLADVVAASWECHSWGDDRNPLCCPIAEAFSCHDLAGVPLLLRPRAEQFIQLFDAGLLPRPVAADPA